MPILANDPPEAREARARLVSAIAADNPWIDARVLEVMRVVPRHLFVDAPLDLAYEDRPLSIGWEQTISQPTVVAMMSHALSLRGAERVLEIGTGSGYQTAILSLLAAQVDSIEIVAELADSARERLAALGYTNVNVRSGDGYRGWPERAPYDRIILTAAPPELPAALSEQLDDLGMLVAPVGPLREQRLVWWRKQEGERFEDMGRVRFVPMVHGPPLQ